MIFQKNKVEEDLERMRNANLTPEQIKAYSNRVLTKKRFNIKNKKNIFNDISSSQINEYEYKEKLVLEKNDILAVILAVLSLVLPYVLVFIGIMCLVIYLLTILY